jgi:hypothetical protein
VSERARERAHVASSRSNVSERFGQPLKRMLPPKTPSVGEGKLNRRKSTKPASATAMKTVSATPTAPLVIAALKTRSRLLLQMRKRGVVRSPDGLVMRSIVDKFSRDRHGQVSWQKKVAELNTHTGVLALCDIPREKFFGEDDDFADGEFNEDAGIAGDSVQNDGDHILGGAQISQAGGVKDNPSTENVSMINEKSCEEEGSTADSIKDQDAEMSMTVNTGEEAEWTRSFVHSINHIAEIGVRNESKSEDPAISKMPVQMEVRIRARHMQLLWAPEILNPKLK